MDWNIRSQDSIAQNCLTNSKKPDCFVKGVYPTHLAKGSGPYVTDTNGKRYYDFICGLGSNILGYGNALIAEAIYHQAMNGATLSLSTTTEVILAEKLKEVFPFIRKMKFLKSGSEACSAAIKIARARTGRIKVLSNGYHGWHDSFVSLTPPATGVSIDSNMVLFNDDLNQIDGTVAAVIIEPINLDFSEQRIRFLENLRKKCNQTGALLIFDEVITGFRVPKFSVSNLRNIDPDIICLGKALGNGMPINVVAGAEYVMDSNYFVSSTFAGETLSMVSALKMIEMMQNKKFDLEYLWERGGFFIQEFNKIFEGKLKIKGYNTRGVLDGEPMFKALFMQEACLAGLLFGPSFFINFSHLPHLDVILNLIKDVSIKLKTGKVQLLGEMPQAPFAQKARELNG